MLRQMRSTRLKMMIAAFERLCDQNQEFALDLVLDIAGDERRESVLALVPAVAVTLKTDISPTNFQCGTR